MREFRCILKTPEEADIRLLAERMRADDRRELKRWTGQDPEYEVRHSVKCSEYCRAAYFADGSLACIFGACRANLVDEDAVIWLLSTDAVDSHPIEFYSASKVGLDAMARAMPDVADFYNFVDLDYAKACRWLEHLGFDKSMKVGARLGFRGGRFAYYYFPNPHYKED